MRTGLPSAADERQDAAQAPRQAAGRRRARPHQSQAAAGTRHAVCSSADRAQHDAEGKWERRRLCSCPALRHAFPSSLLLQLPRSTLLLEEELANLLAAHRGGACPCQEGPGGAPVYCRLGVPPNATSAPLLGGSSGGNSSSSDGDGGSDNDPSAHGTVGSEGAGEAAGGQGAAATSSNSSSSSSSEPQHRLAVLIPYRDRLQHLTALLAELRPHLERQRRPHDVFIVEQVGWALPLLLPVVCLCVWFGGRGGACLAG